MDTTLIKAEKTNITDSQRQQLEKWRQMTKILKGKIDQTQKSNATGLVKTIKRLIVKPVNKLRPPFFSFNTTHEAAFQNIQIWAALNGNLGVTIEAQNGSPLDYG